MLDILVLSPTLAWCLVADTLVDPYAAAGGGGADMDEAGEDIWSTPARLSLHKLALPNIALGAVPGRGQGHGVELAQGEASAVLASREELSLGEAYFHSFVAPPDPSPTTGTVFVLHKIQDQSRHFLRDGSTLSQAHLIAVNVSAGAQAEEVVKYFDLPNAACVGLVEGKTYTPIVIFQDASASVLADPTVSNPQGHSTTALPGLGAGSFPGVGAAGAGAGGVALDDLDDGGWLALLEHFFGERQQSYERQQDALKPLSQRLSQGGTSSPAAYRFNRAVLQLSEQMVNKPGVMVSKEGRQTSMLPAKRDNQMAFVEYLRKFDRLVLYLFDDTSRILLEHAEVHTHTHTHTHTLARAFGLLIISQAHLSWSFCLSVCLCACGVHV